jgi:hypothetical protein
MCLHTGNFFWSFPSKTAVVLRNKLAAVTEEKEQQETRLSGINKRKRDATVGREDDEDTQRSAKLKKLSALQTSIAEAKVEIEKYSANSPEMLDKLKADVAVCKEAANRWTENIYLLFSFIKKKKPGMSDADLLKAFQLPADFDYVE